MPEDLSSNPIRGRKIPVTFLGDNNLHFHLKPADLFFNKTMYKNSTITHSGLHLNFKYNQMNTGKALY